MKKALRATLVALILLSFAGCYRQSIRAVDAEGNLLTDRGGLRESDTTFGLLYGLVPGKTKVECPYGIARVDTGLAWYSYFVMYLTAAIVVPMKATYTCNEAPDEGSAAPNNGGW